MSKPIMWESGLMADQYITDFVDVVGADRVARDMGWTEKRVKARATRLRNTGAFAVLRNMKVAQAAFLADYHERIGTEYGFDISIGMVEERAAEEIAEAAKAMRDKAWQIENDHALFEARMASYAVHSNLDPNASGVVQ